MCVFVVVMVQELTKFTFVSALTYLLISLFKLSCSVDGKDIYDVFGLST